MRDVAAWLVARPQNAVAVLCISMLVPLLQPVSAVALTVLVLAHRPLRAAAQAVLAAALLAAVLLLTGMQASNVIVLIAVTWLPVFLLASLLVSTRSFALTMQVSVLAAVVCAVTMGVLVDDAVAFWEPMVETGLQMLGRSGAAPNEAAVVLTPEFADRFAALFFVSAWFFYALIFMLGYLAFATLSTGSGDFGRMRDLNFGRVLASGLLVVVVLSAVTGSVLAEIAAIVLFASFMLQALALTYWIGEQRKLPAVATLAVYVLTFTVGYVSALMMVAGYLDAWFDVRRRLSKT